jgi:hypothetical protein
MNIQGQVKKEAELIVDNLIGGSGEHLKYPEITEAIEIGINRLIYIACQQQKQLCADNAKTKTEYWHNREGDTQHETYIDGESILNAPLPIECEKYFSEKEVKEISMAAIQMGMQGNDHFHLYKKFYNDVLSKEYGIKL